MRDFIILVIVCVGVVVGVGWYLLPGPAHNLFRTTVDVKPPDPEPEKVAPQPEKVHKVAAKPAPKAEQMPVAEIVMPAKVPAPQSPLVRPVRVVVPKPGEVSLGVDRSRIIDSYGDPSLLASTADRGHLFETMVYRHERRQAIIKLEDGVVSSVYAK